MKTLVIYAHPKTKGHNPVVLKEVEAQLKKRKESYKVLDLYKMKYNPVLHEKEHYTAGKYAVSAENKKIQKLILASDHLIFIYPVWWYSMPAILKGFFDRVMTPRFAFIYEGKLPKGLLKDKEATVFFTTGGPTIFYKLTGNPPKKHIKTILKFCGISTKVYQIGKCNKFDAAKIKQIKKTVAKAFSGW